MTHFFDASIVLKSLKDFQRQTVEHVFNRLFDASNPATRFLVADEVGLGKTLVAKGVVAKTVEYLQRRGQRQVSVVYICSNTGIATQNVKRLSLPSQSAYVESTRLTLLPLKTVQLKEHPVSFISFTPGTTFNQGAKRGRKDERKLIYQMLRDLPYIRREGLLRAMRGAAGEKCWTTEAEWPLVYDEGIAQEFRTRISQDAIFKELLTSLCQDFADDSLKPWTEQEKLSAQITADLRRLLAKICLGALNPDLVILDEFQRFRELFDAAEENPAAELAKALFDYAEGTRTLLLSATPYKMYASYQEDEDHHSDFLRTVQFLLRDDAKALGDLQSDLSAFRTELLSVSETGLSRLAELKSRIENALRSVMCRTERVGATRQANAMVKEWHMVPQLMPRDLKDLRWLEAVADRLNESGVMEYWKSSPYLLNFMKEYSFKRSLRKDQDHPISNIAELLEAGKSQLLSAQDIAQYAPIDAGNPRLRALLDALDTQGLWRILWMPASMPYWQPQGVFEHVGSVTKHLVFSAWNLVPDALASVLSYEVERRLMKHAGVSHQYDHKPSRRLRFTKQDGRLSGMFTLMLMFPSTALVRHVDPLALRREVGASICSFEDLKQRGAARLKPLLAPLVGETGTGDNCDRRWYWVALARLEGTESPQARAWCERTWANARVGGGEDVDGEGEGLADEPRTGFTDHVQFWLQAWEAPLESMGPVPPDLAEVLATVALAGPAACALRTLARHWPLDSAPLGALLSASARIAEGFRSQFNSPRAAWLLASKEDDDIYWERVLHYSADGNLQAVLDEHSHVLFESSGLPLDEPEKAVSQFAQAIFEALSLRTSSLHPDDLQLNNGQLKVVPFSTGIRTHFAVRYGAKTDDDGSNMRKETVQAAFNSPFWPFVLISTSVGQEGLDFHTWCHSVIHWNLPSNPVDLEQREGRVHRYKGYAVRKNAAALHGQAVLAAQAAPLGTDPWLAVFSRAAAERTPEISELIPYWIFETPEGASIERRVMLLPLSRDEAKYRRLRRSLALYRMVFAQPRQEDLLAYLETAIDPEQAMAFAAQWSINLAPPPLIPAALGAEHVDIHAEIVPEIRTQSSDLRTLPGRAGQESPQDGLDDNR